jgi:hypothetical protein
LKQINKSIIKVIVTLCVRVLHINIGCKHDVFMCLKGIAKSFENLKYVKPPNEGITGFSRMFSMMGGGGIAKPTHLMHVVHIGGLDQTIEPR